MSQTPEGATKAAAARIGMPIEEYLARAEAGMKRCTKCKEWRPVPAYNRDSTRFDGLSARCLECTRVKIRKNTKGRVSYFKGRKHTPESREAISAAKKGKPGPRKGIPHTAETRQLISNVTRERTPKKDRHPNWKGGLTPINEAERASFRYSDWRKAVFARDGFACQQCGDSRGGNLQAHHVRSFANHPELRYDVDNGVTLCRDCHEKIHLKPIPTKTDLRRRKKHTG